MLLLGIAQAIAAGSPFCGWRRGQEPSIVLFLDYEMGREELQKRLRFFQHPNLFAVSFDDPQLDSDEESASAAKAKRVKWDGELPAVDTPLGQKLVENLIRATVATTIIIDNLYAACDGDLLGGASTRGGFQAHEVLVPWARRMSKAGVQTIWVQHSNEQGSPYGDKRLNRQMYLHLHIDWQRSKNGPVPGHREPCPTATQPTGRRGAFICHGKGCGERSRFVLMRRSATKQRTRNVSNFIDLRRLAIDKLPDRRLKSSFDLSGNSFKHIGYR